MTYSIPAGNLLQGRIASITTDTVTGEVSYVPINFPVGKSLEAIIPVTNAAGFAIGNTVTCMVKATAVSLLSYPIV